MDIIGRRKKAESEADLEYIRQILDYNPETGDLVWKERRSLRVNAGDLAGFIRKSGYRFIKIDGRGFMAHRLAWALAHGRWPAEDIDHINGQPADNRLANLREASRSQNCANRTNRGVGKSGIKGIQWHKANQKWIVAVGKKYVGSFSNIEDAQAAYRRVAEELYGQFTRHD
jgi:hypothetical protein